MKRVRTRALAVVAVAVMGLVGPRVAARGGGHDPAEDRAVEAIERAGGWVCPPFLLYGRGCVVSIEGEKATDDVLVYLRAVKGLRVLSLDGSRITDAGLAHVKRVSALNVLSLANTDVTDGGLAHLAGMTTLRELDLSGTLVTDAGLTHLNELVHLRTLTVAGTEVSSEGAKALRRSLPRCRIRGATPAGS